MKQFTFQMRIQMQIKTIILKLKIGNQKTINLTKIKKKQKSKLELKNIKIFIRKQLQILENIMIKTRKTIIIIIFGIFKKILIMIFKILI